MSSRLQSSVNRIDAVPTAPNPFASYELDNFFDEMFERPSQPRLGCRELHDCLGQLMTQELPPPA